MKRQTILGTALAATLIATPIAAQELETAATLQTGVTTEHSINNRLFFSASYGKLGLEGMYSIDNLNPKDSFGEYGFTYDTGAVRPLVSVKSDGTSIDDVLIGVQVPTKHCGINIGANTSVVETAVQCTKNYDNWTVSALYVGELHDGLTNYVEAQLEYKLGENTSAYIRVEDIVEQDNLRAVAGIAYRW